MLTGKHAPGAPKTSLYLIRDKNRAVFATQFGGCRQIPVVGNTDALALDRIRREHTLTDRIEPTAFNGSTVPSL